jgi:hypothetical protein
MSMQISQDEYTLFSANIFFRLRAYMKSRRTANLLDLLVQYLILGFCEVRLKSDS